METTEGVSHAQALIGKLSARELEFLRALVAGESQRTIALRLALADAEAGALKQSLMRKLAADVVADLVRVGIYAGL